MQNENISNEYMQNVNETRTLFNNMLTIISTQERNIQHFIPQQNTLNYQNSSTYPVNTIPRRNIDETIPNRRNRTNRVNTSNSTNTANTATTANRANTANTENIRPRRNNTTPRRTNGISINMPRNERINNRNTMEASGQTDISFNNTNIREGPPTVEEIENATQTLLFSNISNPINSQCPIIHEEFENNSIVIKINHCGHIFTPPSLRRWFETNHCCPVCRHNITGRQQNNQQTEIQLGNLFDHLFNNTTNDILYEYTLRIPTYT
tara:strand:+ start:27786 stop:28583 length:798 start_codon:yes stop_codon:yes gene_type:complete